MALNPYSGLFSRQISFGASEEANDWVDDARAADFEDAVSVGGEKAVERVPDDGEKEELGVVVVVAGGQVQDLDVGARVKVKDRSSQRISGSLINSKAGNGNIAHMYSLNLSKVICGKCENEIEAAIRTCNTAASSASPPRSPRRPPASRRRTSTSWRPPCG